MGTKISAGKEVLRAHLADVFAEVSCYSSKDANELIERYPDYRHAVADLNHEFWGRQARRMLDEANKIEFQHRIRLQREEDCTIQAAF